MYLHLLEDENRETPEYRKIKLHTRKSNSCGAEIADFTNGINYLTNTKWKIEGFCVLCAKLVNV